MDFVNLVSFDDQKLRIDSVAALPRRLTSGQPLRSDPASLASREGLHLLLFLGTSRGCVAQYAVDVKPAPGAGGEGLAAAGGAHAVSARQTHMRNLGSGEGNVPFLHVDDELREPRVLALCNGRVSMLHFQSLEPVPAFGGLRQLDGATLCCVAAEQAADAPRRMAVVARRQVHCVEYTEFAAVVVATAAAATAAASLASAAAAAGSAAGAAAAAAPGASAGGAALGGAPAAGGPAVITVPDGATQMAWHRHVLLLGTKREYGLYDMRSGQLIDHVVFDKLPYGPLLRVIRPLGAVAVRVSHGVRLFDSRIHGALDAAGKAVFSEEVVDVGYCHPLMLGVRSDGRVLVKSVVDDQEIAHSHQFGFGQATRVVVGGVPLCVFGATNSGTLGCLVAAPASALVARFVRLGQYDRAAAHFEGGTTTAAASGGGGDKAADERSVAGLQRVHVACAAHALGLRRFALAFRHLEAADVSAAVVAACVPELQRPGSANAVASGSKGSDSALPVTSFEGSGAAEGYALLFQFLKRRRVVVAVERVGGGSAEPSREERAVDYAIFVLLVTGRVAFTDDDLTNFFLPACALIPDECLPFVQDAVAAAAPSSSSTTATTTAAAATMSPVSANAPPFPLGPSAAAPGAAFATTPPQTATAAAAVAAPAASSAAASKARFLSLLLASSGDFAEALRLCRRLQLASEAIVPLQLAGDVALYVEHLPWMLQLAPSVAVKAVFANSQRCAASPPVEVILPLVLPYSGVPLRDYLGSAIARQGCRDPAVHTLHAVHLAEMAAQLRVFAAFPDVKALRVRAGQEAGLLGDVRRQLLQFLRASTAYDGDVVLAALEAARLVEEQVEVHRREGDHAAALALLVYSLDDVASAEAYCVEQHGGNGGGGGDDDDGSTASPPSATAGAGLVPSASQPLLSNASIASASSEAVPPPLLPPNLNSSGLAALTPLSRSKLVGFGARGGAAAAPVSTRSFGALGGEGGTAASASGGGGGGGAAPSCSNPHFNVLLRTLLVPPPRHAARLPAALELLERQARAIDAVAAFEALPGDVCVAQLAPFFARVFQGAAHRHAVLAVAAATAEAARRCEERRRLQLRQRCVFVDDERPCAVCRARLGEAVFGVFPNLKVAHFRCFHARDLDPERGVPFRVGL